MQSAYSYASAEARVLTPSPMPLVSQHFAPSGQPRPVQFVPHVKPGPRKTDVCLSPEVEELLAGGAAVSMGVSGGKDSVAGALALDDYLRRIGYPGRRSSSTATWASWSGKTACRPVSAWQITWAGSW